MKHKGRSGVKEQQVWSRSAQREAEDFSVIHENRVRNYLLMQFTF